MKYRKVVMVVLGLLVLVGVYRGAEALVRLGRSSEDIFMEDKVGSEGSRVYNDSVNVDMGIPYATLRTPSVLFGSEDCSNEFSNSVDILSEITCNEPEDKSLILVDNIDFDSEVKIQYIVKPLEIVSLCGDYTVVYEYGQEGVDYIVMDYSNVPMDSSIEELLEVGSKERVLINLSDSVLKDNILYVKGYRYGFDNIDDCLMSLYFEDKDTVARSIKFIEGYLSLPYSPFRNISVYLVDEDDRYYNFAVLYNDTEEMMVRSLKGSKPYLIHSDSFSYEVEEYFLYTDMFNRCESEGEVVWENIY